MALGENVYNDPKLSFLKRYAEAGDSPEAVYQADVKNLTSKADFYGQQADIHGAKADALNAEAAPTTGGGSSLQKMGAAAAQGGSTADMLGNAGMASGNPYAMAGGLALKVASAAQDRKQKQMDAERAAFMDRLERQRQSVDKLIAMDFGI